MPDTVISVEGLGRKYRIAHQAERQRYVALRDVLVEKIEERGQRSDVRSRSARPSHSAALPMYRSAPSVFQQYFTIIFLQRPRSGATLLFRFFTFAARTRDLLRETAEITSRR